jgi:DNA polymerase-1
MERHDTKTLTYTIQYGGGLKRLSAVFGVSTDRADSIRSGFYTAYPGFRTVSNLAQRKAKFVGKIKLWSGRYRHFAYPKDEAHKAFNSVIQGGAADIVEGTMVRLFERVDNDQECRMLLQVHDSVIFEILTEKEDYYLPIIKETMENVEPDFGVKFAVDAHRFGAE